MKYVHTNIICKDWKQLADFYIKTFQCTIKPPKREQSGQWLERGTGVQNAALKGVHLLLPGYDDHGPTLEIYQYSTYTDQGTTYPNTLGYSHIAFEVANVEKTVAEVIKNGGKKYGETVSRTIANVGKITFAYMQDPEGNFIEIQHWDKE